MHTHCYNNLLLPCPSIAPLPTIAFKIFCCYPKRNAIIQTQGNSVANYYKIHVLKSCGLNWQIFQFMKRIMDIGRSWESLNASLRKQISSADSNNSLVQASTKETLHSTQCQLFHSWLYSLRGNPTVQL